MPRVAHTHEAPGLEGDKQSEPPLLTLHLTNLDTQTQQRNSNPRARQGPLFKPANTTGDIALLLSSSSKGIKESNGHTAIYRDLGLFGCPSLPRESRHTAIQPFSRRDVLAVRDVLLPCVLPMMFITPKHDTHTVRSHCPRPHAHVSRALGASLAASTIMRSVEKRPPLP